MHIDCHTGCHWEQLQNFLHNNFFEPIPLQAVFSKKDLNTWLHLLKTHQVPAAQIRDMPAVFELPAAQNMILEELLPDGSLTKRLRTVAFAMQH